MIPLTVTDLIIYGFAIWRVSNLLVEESGPYFIFRKIRELSGIRHDADGFAYHIPETFFAQVLSCVWCCSLWVGLFWFILWWSFPILSLKIAVVFSFSAVAILIDLIIKSLMRNL